MEPTGRLELTWTNKHLRLITTDAGGYDWVAPADPRVSEVRLLHDLDSVGDVGLDGPGNMLIEGDALHALAALNRIHEFARHFAGRIRLVYIDPPFNTGQAFANYDDNLEHSVWLSMLRDRLVQIKPLLATDGSIWVHLDDAEVHRCRCVMDEILGSANFVASIVWEKDKGRRNDTDISGVHDTLLVYAPEPANWARRRNLLERTESQTARYRNPDGDPRGPWLQGDNGTAKSGSDASRYSIQLPSGRWVRPPEGNYWRFSPETFEKAREEGRVYFGQDGNRLPLIKRYLTDVQQGVVPRSWWPADEVGSNQEAKRDHLRKMFPGLAPFATPKPERLLQRIVHIATNSGDIVLDCFAGSGTTAAVAHKMGRRWVTVEREAATVARFTRPRLEKVVAGEDPGGITSAVEWKGGGGFRHLKVGPSMFDLDPETGDVLLAEWATNGAFSEAVAVQLGLEKVDEPPFCGRKGRTRLAVLDGVVGATEMDFLVASLGERERVVVVGKAFTDDAEARLRELSPGSRIRHAPHDLLRRGARQ